jgi:hypothetical protein
MAFVIHSTIDLLLNQQRTDGPTLLFTLASLRGWLWWGFRRRSHRKERSVLAWV